MKKTKSYLFICFFVWLLGTSLIIYLKYIVYMKNKDSFGVGLIYLFSTIMFVGILSMYEYNKLVIYIEEKYPKESKAFTGILEKRVDDEF